MTLVEVDLENNYILELPKSQKGEMMRITALENGWSATVTNVEQKEFHGTPKEMDTFISNIKENIRLLNKFPDYVLYEETVVIDNPVSAYDFGVQFLQEYVGSKFRADHVSHSTKALAKTHQAEMEASQKASKSGLDDAFKGLTAR